MSPPLKAWGNSTRRNFSRSATLIFAIAMSLRPEVFRLASRGLLPYDDQPALMESPMSAQTARAPAPQPTSLLRETLGSIAVLTLNRPQARNSLSEGLIAELHAALRNIQDDTRVRAG